MLSPGTGASVNNSLFLILCNNKSCTQKSCIFRLIGRWSFCRRMCWMRKRVGSLYSQAETQRCGRQTGSRPTCSTHLNSCANFFQTLLPFDGCWSVTLEVSSVFRLTLLCIYSNFYDFWIKYRWIRLISWIELVLKNYLCIVLSAFHGKLRCLFTENNLFGIYKWTLSIDTNCHFPWKVTLSTDDVTLCTLYASN